MCPRELTPCICQSLLERILVQSLPVSHTDFGLCPSLVWAKPSAFLVTHSHPVARLAWGKNSTVGPSLPCGPCYLRSNVQPHLQLCLTGSHCLLCLLTHHCYMVLVKSGVARLYQLPQGCYVVEGKRLGVRRVEYTCFVIVTHIVIFVSANNKELHHPLQPCSMGNSGSAVQASFDILNGTYPQQCVRGCQMPSIAYHLQNRGDWTKHLILWLFSQMGIREQRLSRKIVGEFMKLLMKTCVIKLSSSPNLDDWHCCDAMWAENGANSISMKGGHFDLLHSVVAIMLLCNRMGLIQTNHMTSWHFGTNRIPHRKRGQWHESNVIWVRMCQNWGSMCSNKGIQCKSGAGNAKVGQEVWKCEFVWWQGRVLPWLYSHKVPPLWLGGWDPG